MAQLEAESKSSIDEAEVAKFDALAAEWWDPSGKFRPLHLFNPVRLAFIKDRVCGHFERNSRQSKPFDRLRLLDIGCGGGLLSEPMRRLGAQVTGADAAPRNIEIAISHARQQELEIDYKATTAEAMLDTGERFDVVLNMEVAEHVADPADFLLSCSGLLKPGGIMIVATVNRTAKSYALAIVGAEYVLRWVPIGTHQWSKFLKPSEIERMLKKSGLNPDGPFGVAYNPLRDRWSLSKDTAVNYMMVGKKPL